MELTVFAFCIHGKPGVLYAGEAQPRVHPGLQGLRVGSAWVPTGGMALGVVEAVWSIVAVRRWSINRRSGGDASSMLVRDRMMKAGFATHLFPVRVLHPQKGHSEMRRFILPWPPRRRSEVIG
jgi:hypothetical protein